MLKEPATGNSRRRHGAPFAGYSRIPIRSVSRIKATTVRPVNAPITSVRTKNIWSSRSRNLRRRSNSHIFVQLSLVVWSPSLILSEMPFPRHHHSTAPAPAPPLSYSPAPPESAANPETHAHPPSALTSPSPPHTAQSADRSSWAPAHSSPHP